MYTGDDSVYTYTFEHERKPDCPVCGAQSMNIQLPHDTTMTLGDFIEQELQQRPSM